MSELGFSPELQEEIYQKVTDVYCNNTSDNYDSDALKAITPFVLELAYDSYEAGKKKEFEDTLNCRITRRGVGRINFEEWLKLYLKNI